MQRGAIRPRFGMRNEIVQPATVFLTGKKDTNLNIYPVMAKQEAEYLSIFSYCGHAGKGEAMPMQPVPHAVSAH